MPVASRLALLCLLTVATLSLPEKARATAVLRMGDPDFCLALALYWEARTEGRHGMLAVAQVVMNRVEHPDFPDEVCAVITQGGETPPCQFSWWCDGKSDRPTEASAWREAQRVAREALTARPQDRTRGALFFHTTSMAKPWRIKRERTVAIGRHVFYR